MRVKAVFSERQPDYKYMERGDGTADVFINNFIKKERNEEDSNFSFIYEQNEFRVNTDEITEEMISESPLDWIDYSNVAEEVSIEDRVSAIEDAVMELIIGGGE